MTSTGRSKDITIGIFGHYGNQNLGDEAIITAVIQNIKQRLPEATLYGFSIQPDDTSKRYNIPAFPIRNLKKPDIQKSNTLSEPAAVRDTVSSGFVLQIWIAKLKALLRRITILYYVFQTGRNLINTSINCIEEIGFLINSYKILKNVDLLAITGSNQFLDNFGGPWGFPYTLLKWTVLAKMTGTKVAFVSVGAGPISSWLSKVFIRSSLLFADYLSLRDEPSKRLLESFGAGVKGSVYPDLAHSLHFDSKPPPVQDKTAGGRRFTVGINPMPVYDSRYWYIGDNKMYFDYVQKLAAFSAVLLREKYTLFFFATMPRDEAVIEDVLAALDEYGINTSIIDSLVKTSRTVDGLMEIFTSADIIVATRFHGTVLSLRAEKPLLSICYYRKADDLMKAMDQADYSVVFESFEVDDLLKRFRALEKNYSIEKNKIKKKNEEYLFALNEQYDTLFRQLIQL